MPFQGRTASRSSRRTGGGEPAKDGERVRTASAEGASRWMGGGPDGAGRSLRLAARRRGGGRRTGGRRIDGRTRRRWRSGPAFGLGNEAAAPVELVELLPLLDDVGRGRREDDGRR